MVIRYPHTDDSHLGDRVHDELVLVVERHPTMGSSKLIEHVLIAAVHTFQADLSPLSRATTSM